MTCPCGEYDYVDSTHQTLSEAMACKCVCVCSTSSKADVTYTRLDGSLDHRERGNRVIHQYLTGSPLNPNATEEYASVTASHSDRVHACICSTFQTRRGHTHASLPAFSALFGGHARISRCQSSVLVFHSHSMESIANDRCSSSDG